MERSENRRATHVDLLLVGRKIARFDVQSVRAGIAEQFVVLLVECDAARVRLLKGRRVVKNALATACLPAKGALL